MFESVMSMNQHVLRRLHFSNPDVIADGVATGIPGPRTTPEKDSGQMNTADRSIALMDVALRRRFRFEECPPIARCIEPRWVGRIDLHRLLSALNDRIEYLLNRDHLIGHGMFMGLHSLPALQAAVAQRVVPLLQEYFFEDLERVNLVLTGSSKGSVFFKARRLAPADLFAADAGSAMGARFSYAMADPSSWSEDDFIRMYDRSPAALPSADAFPADVSG